MAKKFDVMTEGVKAELDTSMAGLTGQKDAGRKTYTKQEAFEAMERGETAGMKGVKMPRLNVAVRPTLKDFVDTLAKALGKSQSDIVAEALEDYLKKHEEEYTELCNYRSKFIKANN